MVQQNQPWPNFIFNVLNINEELEPFWLLSISKLGIFRRLENYIQGVFGWVNFRQGHYVVVRGFKWTPWLKIFFIYNIFKKKICFEPLQHKFAHLHLEPNPFFLKPSLNSKKKKKKVST